MVPPLDSGIGVSGRGGCASSPPLASERASEGVKGVIVYTVRGRIRRRTDSDGPTDAPTDRALTRLFLTLLLFKSRKRACARAFMSAITVTILLEF